MVVGAALDFVVFNCSCYFYADVVSVVTLLLSLFILLLNLMFMMYLLLLLLLLLFVVLCLSKVLMQVLYFAGHLHLVPCPEPV